MALSICYGLCHLSSALSWLSFALRYFYTIVYQWSSFSNLILFPPTPLLSLGSFPFARVDTPRPGENGGGSWSFVAGELGSSPEQGR